MKKLHCILALFALLITLQLDAQDRRPFINYLYADVKLGLGFHNGPYLGSAHTPISIGYRIDQNHAVGITRHFTLAGIITHRHLDYTGYGAEYRYATQNGFIAKATTGLVTGASGGSTYGYWYEYTGGGYFGGLSLEYQLRFGLTFGAYLSTAQNMSFDDYYLDDDTNESVYYNSEKRRLTTAGITLGYALPVRTRKPKDAY